MTEPESTLTIGERLKAWRDSLEINQAEAARRSSVSQATWSDWEGDKKLPSADKAFELERATDGAITARMCAAASAERRAEHSRNSTGTDDE